MVWCLINTVDLCWVRLVRGWVTDYGQLNRIAM